MPTLGRPTMAAGTPDRSTPAPVGGGQQGPEGGLRLHQGGVDLLPARVLDVLVGVVHHGVKPADHLQEPVVDPLHPAAEAAPQLLHGVPCGLCRLRLDEVDDRLRRASGHPAVEEGPLGELPPRPACRTPAAKRARSPSASTTGEPWQWNSALSSPV